MTKWKDTHNIRQIGCLAGRYRSDINDTSRELYLNDWDDVNLTDLRQIALIVGSNIRAVSFSCCKNLTDHMLEVFCSRLFCLQDMDLSACPQIGDLSCRTLSRFCGNTLTRLNLSKCNKITNTALNCLICRSQQSAGPCRHLEFLDISYNKSINDKGLWTIGRNCKKLLHLKIQCSEKISIKGIMYVTKNCRTLTTLDITNCPSITSENLSILLEQFYYLREATTFFGYIRKDRSDDPQIKAKRQELKNKSARKIEVSSYTILYMPTTIIY